MELMYLFLSSVSQFVHKLLLKKFHLSVFIQQKNNKIHFKEEQIV